MTHPSVHPLNLVGHRQEFLGQRALHGVAGDEDAVLVVGAPAVEQLPGERTAGRWCCRHGSSVSEMAEQRVKSCHRTGGTIAYGKTKLPRIVTIKNFIQTEIARSIAHMSAQRPMYETTGLRGSGACRCYLGYANPPISETPNYPLDCHHSSDMHSACIRLLLYILQAAKILHPSRGAPSRLVSAVRETNDPTPAASSCVEGDRDGWIPTDNYSNPYSSDTRFMMPKHAAYHPGNPALEHPRRRHHNLIDTFRRSTRTRGNRRKKQSEFQRSRKSYS